MVEPTIVNERAWQQEADAKMHGCNTNEGNNTIPVNACVGSGKTQVASFALGDFIKENINGKTVQMFVTPRIKLCKQQAAGIASYLKRKFGLVMGEDYDIKRYDCSIDSGTKLNLKSDTFTSKHAIIVICDESLWGTDDNSEDPDQRWHKWLRFFKKLEDAGYKFGNCVFDEAHNFTSKHEKIFGKAA